MQIVKATSLNRRQFLIRTGWIATGVTMLASCSPVYSLLPALPSTNDPEWADAITWVQAMPDGRIRFYCPRMEMGQGASVGLSQVVAEELNVGPNDIECIHPNTAQIPRFKMTVGSQSIASFFSPVSRTSAHLREALRQKAADKTGVDLRHIKDDQGGFRLSTGLKLKYRELVDDKPIIVSEEESVNRENDPPLYSVHNAGKFHAIGNSWKHHELAEIVTGKALYARDASVPGMVYGQVIHPPTFQSNLINANGRMAKKMPGVIAVVIDDSASFVGIITELPSQLPAAVAKLKVKWEKSVEPIENKLGEKLNVVKARENDSFEHTLISQGKSTKLNKARRRVKARYETSFAAHAAMEPRAAIVSVKEDSVEVWCGSQDPFFVQGRVAKALGRKAASVVVYTHRMGGAFGGRVPCQASEEAAVLSKAVSRPVRVQWDRETEFAHNYFQPGFSHFIEAGVSENGLIDHWEHDFVSSPIITGPVPGNIAWFIDKFIADGGTARGGLSPYQAQYQRVRYSDIRTPIPIGAWRGLGSAPNTFAIESMIDELAIDAGIDPLSFRLKNFQTKQNRLINVLQRAAEISGWNKTLPKNTGRGIACSIYQGKTYIAAVAEIQIDSNAKEMKVSKIWCVQDSGLVINPDQVENQIMGNIVWGCSMVFNEEITFESGAVEQRNFDTYKVLRHSETPEMFIELITSEAPPTAVGESAFASVAPAITNAIFDATGVRVRNLPVNEEIIFSKLKK